MFNFFAQIFGYVLELLYNLVHNYGFAIILFTILLRVILLPFSLKQQKTMKKSAKIQEELKVIQFKYKNDPEKMNQEMISLYKDNHMNPMSGCFSSILQLILILSVFYMVRSPLTYMEKLPGDSIENYKNQLVEAQIISQNPPYPEIDMIRNVDTLVEKNEKDENIQKVQELKNNMNFLGLDLNKIPQQNMGDYTVYIIPILYIISTFISMRLTVKMQEEMQNKKQDKNEVIDITEKKDGEEEKEKEEDPMEAMMQTNKMMSWMMPIISVSIALVAPLGLALYWLISNITMIVERLVINKVIKTEEE